MCKASAKEWWAKKSPAPSGVSVPITDVWANTGSIRIWLEGIDNACVTVFYLEWNPNQRQIQLKCEIGAPLWANILCITSCWSCQSLIKKIPACVNEAIIKKEAIQEWCR